MKIDTQIFQNIDYIMIYFVSSYVHIGYLKIFIIHSTMSLPGTQFIIKQNHNFVF